MAQALQPLAPGLAGRSATPDLLRAAPALTLLLFLAPVAAGLIGTWLPAFGWFPALGGEGFGLEAWRRLFADPALPGALRLTLTSGLIGSLGALALVLGFVACFHESQWLARLRRLMAPLLAIPHAAMAIGLAFLLAPSGWLVRLVSPGLTGWSQPPDIALIQDPNGLALALALMVKEAPFLLLITLAALEQSNAPQRLAVARSLGYRPATAWFKTVLPAIYAQLRLPIYAVLAFSLSVVDMALILAPATPPPLAVLVLRWFNDPDLSLRFVAAAGATLQFLLVIGAIAAWQAGELTVRRLARRWLADGSRGQGDSLLRAASGGVMVLATTTSIAALAGLALWSVTGRWRYPDALPGSWSLRILSREAEGLLWSGGTTLLLGLASTIIALLLVLACLENERQHRLRPMSRGLWLLYAPLLVPQVAFLFGVQVLAVVLRIDGTWVALVWSHLLFVLPYVFLALADPYRALDERYERSALCLGAGPLRVFLRVKLPMLLRPIMVAFAIGFAVSVAQYLPTLFAGSGRFATLTTEAVSLSAGADRRVVAGFAFAQALLPLVFFAAAIALPAWLYRQRRGLRGLL